LTSLDCVLTTRSPLTNRAFKKPIRGDSPGRSGWGKGKRRQRDEVSEAERANTRGENQMRRRGSREKSSGQKELSEIGGKGELQSVSKWTVPTSLLGRRNGWATGGGFR